MKNPRFNRWGSDGLFSRFLELEERIFSQTIEELEKETPQDKLPPGFISQVKTAYNEYLEVVKAVRREKGSRGSMGDVKNKIPENLWLKVSILAAEKMGKPK